MMVDVLSIRFNLKVVEKGFEFIKYGEYYYWECMNEVNRYFNKLSDSLTNCQQIDILVAS